MRNGFADWIGGKSDWRERIMNKMSILVKMTILAILVIPKVQFWHD